MARLYNRYENHGRTGRTENANLLALVEQQGREIESLRAQVGLLTADVQAQHSILAPIKSTYDFFVNNPSAILNYINPPPKNKDFFVNIIPDPHATTEEVAAGFVEYLSRHVLPGVSFINVKPHDPIPKANVTLFLVHAVNQKLEGMYDHHTFQRIVRNQEAVFVVLKGVHPLSPKIPIELPREIRMSAEFHYEPHPNVKHFLPSDSMNAASEQVFLKYMKNCGYVEKGRMYNCAIM